MLRGHDSENEFFFPFGIERPLLCLGQHRVLHLLTNLKKSRLTALEWIVYIKKICQKLTTERPIGLENKNTEENGKVEQFERFYWNKFVCMLTL